MIAFFYHVKAGEWLITELRGRVSLLSSCPPSFLMSGLFKLRRQTPFQQKLLSFCFLVTLCNSIPEVGSSKPFANTATDNFVPTVKASRPLPLLNTPPKKRDPSCWGFYPLLFRLFFSLFTSTVTAGLEKASNSLLHLAAPRPAPWLLWMNETQNSKKEERSSPQCRRAFNWIIGCLRPDGNSAVDEGLIELELRLEYKPSDLQDPI